MHILAISSSSGRTGAPMVLLHLLRWLKTRTTATLTILTQDSGELTPEFTKIGDLTALGRWRRLFPKWLQVLPFKTQHWDVIYSNTIMNGWLVDQIRRSKTPVITHVHELEYWIQRGGEENWRRVSQQTSLFIAASQATADNLLQNRGVPQHKLRVIPEFITVPEHIPDRQQTRTELGIGQSDFVLVGGGYEDWRKGKDLFVQLAIQISRLCNRPCHFVWVGNPGDTETRYWLQHDATKAGISSKLHWVGETRTPQKYLAIGDAFAMVSREDPYPLICLEAALLECPIACFANAGGIPELVDQGAGVVVPYLDIHSMAQHFAQWAQNEKLRQEAGKRAKELISTQHLVSVAGPRIYQEICHLCRQKP